MANSTKCMSMSDRVKLICWAEKNRKELKGLVYLSYMAKKANEDKVLEREVHSNTLSNILPHMEPPIPYESHYINDQTGIQKLQEELKMTNALVIEMQGMVVCMKTKIEKLESLVYTPKAT